MQKYKMEDKQWKMITKTRQLHYNNVVLHGLHQGILQQLYNHWYMES